MKVKKIPIPIGNERVVYKGKIIEVIEQDYKVGDKILTFEKARRSPGTRLIIVSKDNKLLITREYRTEQENWDYRLPGGKVFNRLDDYNLFLASGEDIIEKAKEGAYIEAKEETGIKPTELLYYETSKCGATVTWDLFYFIVTEFEELKIGQNLEPGENIEVLWMGIKDVEELVLEGRMKEDRSAAVLLRYISSIA